MDYETIKAYCKTNKRIREICQSKLGQKIIEEKRPKVQTFYETIVFDLSKETKKIVKDMPISTLKSKLKERKFTDQGTKNSLINYLIMYMENPNKNDFNEIELIKKINDYGDKLVNNFNKKEKSLGYRININKKLSKITSTPYGLYGRIKIIIPSNITRDKFEYNLRVLGPELKFSIKDKMGQDYAFSLFWV